MRKFFLLVIASLASLSASIAMAQSQRVQKAESDAPSFYAITSAPTCGISKFTATGDPFALDEVYSDNEAGYITERVLAVYGGGKLFFYQPRINNNSELWKLRFVTYKFDGENWSFDAAVELTPSYNNYPHFLDYDPQTKTLYGFRNGLSGTEEYIIDQTTGAMTFAKQLSTDFYYNMIVTDAYGVTYGTDYDGDFYTLDLSTGEYSKVGNTGIASDDVLTGIEDPTTHKLYQNLSSYGNYSLYEIDKTTGTATRVGSYAAGTNLRGIAPVVANNQGGDSPAPFKLYGLQYQPSQSLVSFDPTTPATVTTEYEDVNNYFRSGSVSAFDGKSLYVYTPKTDSYGSLSKLTFSVYTLDGTEWKMTTEKQLDAQYTNYPNRMAYDPTTGEIYGFRNGMPTTFYTINKETGAMTSVGSVNNGFFASLAIDKNGDFYAFDYDCQLNKVNVADGTFAVVGNLGATFGDMQPTYIDATSNTMYWSSVTSNQAKLYTVDLATGQTTEVGDIPESAKYFGLFGMGSTASADKQAPDVCQDLTVSYATPGTLTATLTATAPQLAFDKTTPLVGKVSLKFYTDESNEPFCTIDDVAAGEQKSADYTFATAGTHKVKVVATNENGDSPAKTVSTFAGFDQPKSPENIQLALAENGSYTVTWDAPTEGVNGGAIDASHIKYIVTQYPGGNQLAETTERTYSGTVTGSVFTAYYFGVKAVCGDYEGEEGYSNHATHGEFAEIPYYDNFHNSDTYGTYTVVNANQDATWQFAKANTGDYAAIYDGSQCNSTADDYLVLPPMILSKGANYTITFNVASAFNQDYGNNLDLVLLKSTEDVNTGKVKIGSFDNIPDYTAGITEKVFTYTATEDGTAYFAFHCRSNANRKVTLYDVQIHGINFEYAPNDVADLTIVAGERGAHTATISFKAPTTDVKGNAISQLSHIKVFRDAEKDAFKSLPDVAAGESCTFTDDAVSAGHHTYKVIAISKQGPSNGISAGVFVGQGIPAAPSNFRVTEDVNDFVLTWDAPTTSTDGNYIDFDKLTYAVYYQYGLMENPDLLNGSVSGCELRVPKEMFDYYASEHQVLISFMLMAQTENGFSSVEATDIIYGKCYELPFTESFQDGYTMTEPWGILSVSDAYVSSWYMIADGNSSKPMDVNSVDGDNGMAMFYQNGVDGYESRLLTPQITAGDATAPTLSLYVYHYNSSAAAHSTLQVELQYEDEEDFVAMGEPINVYGEEGWQLHKIDLSAAECNVYRIALRAKADKKQPIFIDNLMVADDPNNAILGVKEAHNGVRSVDGGLLISANASFAVYTVAGSEVAHGVSDGKKLPLAPGLYLVKVGQTATQCVVR